MSEGYELQIIAHSNLDENASVESDDYTNSISQKISEYHVDGFIVVGQTPRNLESIFNQIRTPVVAFGEPLFTSEAVSWVDTNNLIGGRMAVDYLVSKKKKKIAIITGGLEEWWSVSRFEGYKKGLSKAGIEYDPSLVEHSSNTFRVRQM